MREVCFVSGARSAGGYTAAIAAGVRCLVTGVAALGVAACALLVMTLLVVPRTAHADNGQCQWEGGPGWPTYQNCQLQDCIGAGGYAQCSPPELRPSSGLSDEQVDGQKFIYSTYTPSEYDNLDWCLAEGGGYNGFGGSGGQPECAGLDPDIHPSEYASSSEDTALSTTTAALALKFKGCSITLQSDTGWASSTFPQVGGTYPAIRNGTDLIDAREQSFALGGGGCNSSETIGYLRIRQLSCPQINSTRILPNGDWQCFIPACCSLLVGNPVDPVTGGKVEAEVDYHGAGAAPLELTHYYNSQARFALPGSGPFIATASAYWQFSYQRHLIPVSGNATFMAVLVHESGSLEEFNGSGAEILNQSGAADRLVANAAGWSLTLANGSVETYNTSGNLTSITTLSGLVTTVSYGGNGQISQVADPFGHKLLYSYNVSGQLASVTLPDGSSTVTYGYTTVGALQIVTYPDQTSRAYEYEDPNNSWLLTGITDENGQRYATYVYNNNGMVSHEEHAGGVEAYNFSVGTIIPNQEISASVTDPLGQSRAYVLDNQVGTYKLRYSTSYCSTCPNIGQASFDANGNYQSKTDLNGNQTTYVFDQTRNLELSRTEGLSGSSSTSATRTITTQWHPTLRLPALTTVYTGASASGTPLKSTSYTYDGYGNALTKTITDGSTGASRTWSYSYYNSGLYAQVQTATGPRTDVNQSTSYTYYNCANGGGCGQVHTVTDAANHTTTYGSYDANGLPLSITDPNGIVTTLAYDLRQRLLTRTTAGEQTRYSYYLTGLLQKVTLPDGSFITSIYDAAHRLTELDDSLGDRVVYTVDSVGNRQAERHFDPSGNLDFAHTQLYNSLGEYWQDLTAEAISTQATVYGYDFQGNQTSINGPLSRTTVNGYDPLNRVSQVTDPNQGITQFIYDADDDLVAVTDPRQLTTSYSYNGLGDLGQIRSPDTGVTQNTFDSAGNLHTSTDARGSTATYTFDALNRMTQIAYADQTIGLTYDQGTNGIGHLSTVVDNSGQTSLGYDALGRVNSKHQTIGSVTLSIGYTYTNADLTAVTTPSGQIITYSYNGNHQVGGIAVNGTTLISGIAYSPFGPATGWTWSNGTQTSRSFDLDGHLTMISSAGASTYSFFDDGSIASRSDDWANSYTLPNGATTLAVAASSNQLSSTAGVLSRSYSYDQAGHVTGYAGSTLTYNRAGRLTAVQVGTAAATLAINALGQRVSKSSANGTTLFAYDEAGHLLGEYSAQGQLIEETVWFGDTPVATLQPNGSGGVNVFYIHTDHLNTPRRISRPIDNVVVWRWDSDPFGAAAANEDADGDGTVFAYNLRLPGQYFDGETGLNYNMARDYDPAVGRYVESDPVGLRGGSYSTYAYAGGNPLTLSDPLGLSTFVNFPSDKEAVMKAAIEQAKQTVRNCKGKTGCFDDGGRDKIIKNLDATTYKYDPGFPACGASNTGSHSILGNVTIVGPDAFNWSSCCDLASTLAHEANHLVGILGRSEQSSQELESVCFNCPRTRR